MVKVLGVTGRWEQSVSNVYGGGFSGCFAAVIAHNGTAISVNNRYFKLTGGHWIVNPFSDNFLSNFYQNLCRLILRLKWRNIT
ncbi:hypothetical protein FACS1894111_13060 [Clostridia bacterium]|nr:hypothetical protein FACS1894111_13060 [Clostridia bacterium]